MGDLYRPSVCEDCGRRHKQLEYCYHYAWMEIDPAWVRAHTKRLRPVCLPMYAIKRRPRNPKDSLPWVVLKHGPMVLARAATMQMALGALCMYLS